LKLSAYSPQANGRKYADQWASAKANAEPDPYNDVPAHMKSDNLVKIMKTHALKGAKWFECSATERPSTASLSSFKRASSGLARKLTPNDALCSVGPDRRPKHPSSIVGAQM